MILVGLTGVMGSGKSTVAALLKKHGLEIIDLDALAKEALTREETRNDIRQAFGEEYVVGGEVDRERLAREAFGGKGTLKRLESIVHPRVKEEVERKIARLKKEGVGVVVVDHPLLFEAGFYMKMDRVVVVSAEGQRMRERLRARGMDDKDVERRLSFQVPLEEKEARADYVVRNDGTIDDLTREAAVLREKITEWEEDKHAAQ